MFPSWLVPSAHVLGVSAVFVLAGCGGPNSKKSTDKAPEAGAPAFSEVNPVLEAKCSPCHAQGARHSNLIGGEETFRAFAADIETRITSDDPKIKMPRDLGTKPLTEEEKAVFNAVLGAKTASYAELVPVIDSSCARCHGEKSRHLQFAGKEDVVMANAAQILASVDGGFMPPLSKVLTDVERALLLRYIDAAK